MSRTWQKATQSRREVSASHLFTLRLSSCLAMLSNPRPPELFMNEPREANHQAPCNPPWSQGWAVTHMWAPGCGASPHPTKPQALLLPSWQPFQTCCAFIRVALLPAEMGQGDAGGPYIFVSPLWSLDLPAVPAPGTDSFPLINSPTLQSTMFPGSQSHWLPVSVSQSSRPGKRQRGKAGSAVATQHRLNEAEACGLRRLAGASSLALEALGPQWVGREAELSPLPFPREGSFC